MKAVILAGGLGTRISEETHLRPKPMIEIGGKPILWHIMKTYSSYGVNEFVICCGYMGYVIKEYFYNYYLHACDVTVDIQNNKLDIHRVKSEPWKVTLVDTGLETMTGGRLRRVKDYVGDEFFFTYGDGVADVNLDMLLRSHHQSGKKVTLTAVMPPGRFGGLEIQGDSSITEFKEKPKGDGNYINGGFFVVKREAIDYVLSDDTPWESTPLEKLAKEGQLNAYRHNGFWQPMDTLRDKNLLEQLWRDNAAPWKVWND